ncbi:MAG: Hpt domain-containing protein [Christensenellales bacterium]
MNIYEIYALAGENATDVVNRFGSEVVVEKFALRFLDDPSYENLVSALSSGDTQAAFRAAHTLKGIAANLGFNNLYVAASRLTEKLRGNETPIRMRNLTTFAPNMRKSSRRLRELNKRSLYSLWSK